MVAGSDSELLLLEFQDLIEWGRYPIKELEALRGTPVSTSAEGTVQLPFGTANHSEIMRATQGG